MITAHLVTREIRSAELGLDSRVSRVGFLFMVQINVSDSTFETRSTKIKTSRWLLIKVAPISRVFHLVR